NFHPGARPVPAAPDPRLRLGPGVGLRGRVRARPPCHGRQSRRGRSNTYGLGAKCEEAPQVLTTRRGAERTRFATPALPAVARQAGGRAALTTCAPTRDEVLGRVGRSCGSTWARPIVRPMPYQRLFSPLRVGPVEARNRIVMGAHFTMYTEPADTWGEPGFYGERYGRYLAERARGGAGIIIAGQAQVHPTTAYQMHNNAIAWDDAA